MHLDGGHLGSLGHLGEEPTAGPGVPELLPAPPPVRQPMPALFVVLAVAAVTYFLAQSIAQGRTGSRASEE